LTVDQVTGISTHTDDCGVPHVDSVALSLLRAGSNSVGKWSADSYWDVAVRGALLVDLTLGGKCVLAHYEAAMPMDRGGSDYLDRTKRALSSGGDPIPKRFIGFGDVRSRQVADRLVEAGEWTKRFRLGPPIPQWYVAESNCGGARLRRYLCDLLDRRVAPLGQADAAVAVLGYALGAIRPTNAGVGSANALAMNLSGTAYHLLATTVDEITTRISCAMNANPFTSI
jgi:hypothetical protein